MKIVRKLLLGILVAAMVAGLTINALGATEAEAGKTVTVTFSAKGVCGIDGYFEYSNKEIFKSISYRNDSKLAGDIANDKLYLYGSSETDVTISVTVTLAADAKPGSSCDIILTYETSDLDGSVSDWKTLTKTITVKEKEETKPAETEPPETEPVTQETETDTTPPPETTPVEPEVDYTELKRQQSIATSLDESEYTINSWFNMQEALIKAQNLLKSADQGEVDEGASALEAAIAALVKVNYSELQKAVTTARSMTDTYAHGELWISLFDLLNEADNTIKSRDQKAVDELTEKINALAAELSKDSENSTGKTVEVIKEIRVEVPVDPTDPFCNKPVHKVWPILFIVALVIALGLGVLILLFFIKRKKNEKDDTPLVDYDISDDEDPE